MHCQFESNKQKYKGTPGKTKVSYSFQQDLNTDCQQQSKTIYLLSHTLY